MKIVKKIVLFVVGLVSLVSSLITFYQFNQTSELSLNYKTTCLNDYIDENDNSERVNYIIDDNKFSSLCISEITIQNNGISDITEEDFKNQAIKYYCKNNTKLVKIENIITNEGFVPIIKLKNDTLFIEPILIKKEDKITFTLFSDGEISSIYSSSRIVDLENISTTGVNVSKKKKIGKIIIHIILWITIPFCFAMFFILISGKSTLYPYDLGRKVIDSRPRNIYYKIILFYFILIMILSMVYVFFANEIAFLFMPSIGMFIGTILMFYSTSLQPYVEIKKEEIPIKLMEYEKSPIVK